jgi:hypothetical protein
LGAVVSGQDGRFAVPNVPSGSDYTLFVEGGRTLQQRRFALYDGAKVRPGETTDVGEIRFKGS